MTRILDWSKLKISDKVISTKKALKDVEPWIEDVQNRINDIKDGKVSPKENLKTLVGAGICEENGDLTEPYKPTERYCTIEESLGQSLKEMQLMREDKIPKNTWRELMEELDNE